MSEKKFQLLIEYYRDFCHAFGQPFAEMTIAKWCGEFSPSPYNVAIEDFDACLDALKI